MIEVSAIPVARLRELLGPDCKLSDCELQVLSETAAVHATILLRQARQQRSDTREH